MTIPREEIGKIILSNLTPDELPNCVVYISRSFVPAGQIEFPRLRIDVPWQSYVAFIDREPMANWSHSCRYIFLNRESAEIKSVGAEFPPFQAGNGIKWELLYKAPSVSSEFVMKVD